ncbi:MAG: two-component system histidine kinase PnpS [Candidatus Omnitrophota bacterium]
MMVFLIVLNLILIIIAFKAIRTSRDLKLELANLESSLSKQIDLGFTQEAKLEAVLSSMAEGVLVVDNAGKILLMNPSLRKIFLIDFPPENRLPLEVIRNIYIQEIIDNTLKNQKLISQEILLTSPEEKSLKINSAPILKDKKIKGAMLVFHDITELKRLEKIRQEFVANVSHELRTPLTTIKGYAETLLEGALNDKENSKDFINIIYHDSQRLSKLIDDLLDLSKIESGKLDLVFLPINIKDVVKQALAILDNLAKEKNISMNVEIPKDLPKVLVDESRILQVILNLIDNAIKYTPIQGKIKIEASLDDKFVQVNISDTGIGIPEVDITRIFERFYRVDKARSRELGGTGLGLSIVKHIIQAHNGQVWVKSELGKGSVFSFTLPKA